MQMRNAMGFFNRFQFMKWHVARRASGVASDPTVTLEKSHVARRASSVASDPTATSSPPAVPERSDGGRGELRATTLLSSPRVSEKASILTSKGTYVFNVPVSTGKVEIRKAVEKQYKVTVLRVNTIRGEGKVVHRGRIAGRRPRWKKALVTLKKGQTIELHAGV